MKFDKRTLDLAGQPDYYEIGYNLAEKAVNKNLTEELNINNKILMEGFIDNIKRKLKVGTISLMVALSLLMAQGYSKQQARDVLGQQDDTEQVAAKENIKYKSTGGMESPSEIQRRADKAGIVRKAKRLIKKQDGTGGTIVYNKFRDINDVKRGTGWNDHIMKLDKSGLWMIIIHFRN